MRSRFSKFLTVTGATLFVLAMTAVSFSQAPAQGGRGAAPAPGGAAQPATPAAPAAQGRGGGGGGGRGGGNAAPAEPTPRMPDGTVNFGRTPGDVDGVWNQSWVQNMAERALDAPARGGGGGGGGRGGGAAAAPAPAAGAPAGQAAAAPAAGGRGGGTAAAAEGAAPAAGRGGGGGGGGRAGSAAEPWIPFLPWTAAVYDYHNKNQSKYDPQGYCLPPGGPRLYATPYPMVWIQQPELKRMYHVFEGGAHVWREIFMDGRPHPPKDALNGSTWLGHSVGRWEGDTLVVDVTNFNEGSWISYYGHPHTDQLHLIERWTRPNKATLRYEVTIDDPGAYSKPWTIAWTIPWSPGRIDEYICQENNGYLNSLKDDFGRFIIDRGDGQ